jgi:hypothetical protein
MSLLVISRCYFPPQEVELFSGHMMATARRVGLEPLRFGIGEQMSTHGGSGEGPGALAVLESRTEEVVLCCDSMDVAFLAGEEEILEKFSHMNSDFVVSGEMCALHNMEKSSARLQLYPGYFKEINVGLWIGKRTHAIEVLRYAIDHYRYHDDTHGQDTLQTWLPLMYVEGGGPEFEIDRDCYLFQSMNRVHLGDFVFKNKRMVNIVTGSYPVALHYNGDKSRSSYFEMVKRLTA